MGTGICNYKEKPLAVYGGALVAATGLDMLLPVPMYQRPVHWALGGLLAQKVFKGGDLPDMQKPWEATTMAGMGILGGIGFYSSMYALGRIMG